MTTISTLIYAYNSESQLKRTLSGIETLLHDQVSEIIVIDDASDDDTANYITIHFPTIKLIQNDTFIGYADSINTAISTVTSKWIMVLQSDTHLTSAITSTLNSLDTSSSKTAAVLPNGQWENGVQWRWCCRFVPHANNLSQAILVNRDAFLQLHGLPSLYYPGGYEWADFLYHATQQQWCYKVDPSWEIIAGQSLLTYWFNQPIVHQVINARNEWLFTWVITRNAWHWLWYGMGLILILISFRIMRLRALIHALSRLPDIIIARQQHATLTSSETEPFESIYQKELSRNSTS